MTTSIAEEMETAQATARGAQPKPTKKAHAAPLRAHVTSSKAKSGKKDTADNKNAKSTHKAGSARHGSKTAKVLDLLRRSGGATLRQLMNATGWQPHSVRGFLSGTVRKKMALTIRSAKGEDGERSYSVKA